MNTPSGTNSQEMKIIKKVSIRIGLMLLCTGLFYHVPAQMVDNPDSIRQRLDKLSASEDPSDRHMLNERLKLLAASDDEINMSIAASYYLRIKNVKAFDSLCAAQVIKFPKGMQARIKAQQAITAIKSLPEMEKAYNGFIKNFPPDSYPRLPLGEDRLTYDRIRNSLANGYAKEKNAAKAHYYAGLLEADFWKGKAYGDISNAFYANGDLVNAAFYQKRVIENDRPYAEGKMGNSPASNFAAKGYAEKCRAYAQILYRQKKYNEALKYIETAVKAAKAPGAAINYTYAEILAALNRSRDAYERMEAAVKSGEASGEMADFFKNLYVKVKGSNAGLDAYEKDIRKGVVDDLRKRLTTNMINEPAPDFTLTDLQGNQVSLADLKGKIVILDFWATWCVPCKASFPAMQMAVDKYRDDPTIQFLFIHTWERTTVPTEDASAYIAGMKYSFEVLMDTKDPETKANKVVDSYHVVSIPAKFIIDEKGNIRFKLTGFNGSKEAAVDELSMIIDMVRAKS